MVVPGYRLSRLFAGLAGNDAQRCDTDLGM